LAAWFSANAALCFLSSGGLGRLSTDRTGLAETDRELQKDLCREKRVGE